MEQNSMERKYLSTTYDRWGKAIRTASPGKNHCRGQMTEYKLTSGMFSNTVVAGIGNTPPNRTRKYLQNSFFFVEKGRTAWVKTKFQSTQNQIYIGLTGRCPVNCGTQRWRGSKQGFGVPVLTFQNNWILN